MKPITPQRLQAGITAALQMGRLAKFRRETARLVSESRVGDVKAHDDLQSALDSALATLSIVAQPLVTASNGPVFAHEVLVRTAEPRIPHPGALFDTAARLGRIPDVSRKIRALASEAAAMREDLLFVNLHPRDLLDDELYDAAAPLSAVASRVVLEITERATLDDIDDLRRRVTRLRELGYRVAVDDLGAGYSGLSTFCALEPEVAKADMSLVRNVDRSSTKQRLVRSLVETCRDLNILFIAEGVETLAELEVLQRLGCDRFQGYLFARPGPPFPEVSWPHSESR